MYIGVPAREFMTAGASAVAARGLFAALVLAMVLLPFTMTWLVSGDYLADTYFCRAKVDKLDGRIGT
jgi:hypothetical protein